MKLGIDERRDLTSPGDESKPDTSFIGGTLDHALNTPPYERMFDEARKRMRLGSIRWLRAAAAHPHQQSHARSRDSPATDAVGAGCHRRRAAQNRHRVTVAGSDPGVEWMTGPVPS